MPVFFAPSVKCLQSSHHFFPYELSTFFTLGLEAHLVNANLSTSRGVSPCRVCSGAWHPDLGSLMAEHPQEQIV